MITYEKASPPSLENTLEESSLKVFLQKFGRILEFRYFKDEPKKKGSEGKHVVLFFHGFYGSQWDFEYIKSQIYLENQQVVFYSIRKTEALHDESF